MTWLNEGTLTEANAFPNVSPVCVVPWLREACIISEPFTVGEVLENVDDDTGGTVGSVLLLLRNVDIGGRPDDSIASWFGETVW